MQLFQGTFHIIQIFVSKLHFKFEIIGRGFGTIDKIIPPNNSESFREVVYITFSCFPVQQTKNKMRGSS